jgi:outer membrane protein
MRVALCNQRSESMKKAIWMACAVVTCWSLFVPRALAQHKIGYVNLYAVLEGTEEGKAIVDRLKNEFSAKQKELDGRMKEFEEKAKQFQRQANMLKEDVRAQRAQALAKEEQELKGLFMQYQNAINKKKTDALADFEGKLQGVIEKVAKREGIDFILRTEMLLHAPPKMDLTNQIVREYDKTHASQKAQKGKKGKKGK